MTFSDLGRLDGRLQFSGSFRLTNSDQTQGNFHVAVEHVCNGQVRHASRPKGGARARPILGYPPLRLTTVNIYYD